MNLLKRIIKHWSFLLLILISIIGLVLNNLGLLPENRILSFILIIICTLAVNQIIMHEKTMARLKSLTNNIENIKEVNINDFYSELKEAVINANNSIDLTIHQSTNPSIGIKARVEYFKSIGSIIKSDKIRVRRITSVNSTEKLNLLNEWLTKYGSCSNFHIKYTEVESSGFIRALSIQIVDSKKIFLAGVCTGEMTESRSNVNVIIESEVLGRVFQNYYDSYWNSLKSIKEGKRINHELLQIIDNEING